MESEVIDFTMYPESEVYSQGNYYGPSSDSRAICGRERTTGVPVQVQGIIVKRNAINCSRNYHESGI